MDGGHLMPSPKAQKLIAAQRSEADPKCLIKITHPFADMYFANTAENITYKGVIYNAASFSVKPPDIDGARYGNATLTISAIDQFWIERIRSTQIPAKLQFIAAIVWDEANVMGIEALEENSFTLRAASWDELSISWELSFDERMNYIITSIKCTSIIAPGCA
jgi:hypothetical protein